MCEPQLILPVNTLRTAFDMIKNVYEIRLKMSWADSTELHEAEVACFDAATMIVLAGCAAPGDVEYVNKVCAWASDAMRLALAECKESTTFTRGAAQP